MDSASPVIQSGEANHLTSRIQRWSLCIIAPSYEHRVHPPYLFDGIDHSCKDLDHSVFDVSYATLARIRLTNGLNVDEPTGVDKGKDRYRIDTEYRRTVGRS